MIHACSLYFSMYSGARVKYSVINFKSLTANIAKKEQLWIPGSRNMSAHYCQFSRSVVSGSSRPHRLQHTRLPCPTPRACSNSCLSSWRCHPTISSCHPPSPSAFNLSQHQGLFQWASSSYQVAKVLEFHLQYQPFQWIFRTDFL